MKRVTAKHLLFVFACNFFIGCDNSKIDLPTNDTTPPKLTWHVTNKADNKAADYSGTADINANTGDEFTVMLKASDADGGIKYITLGGSLDWSCKSEGPDPLGQKKDALLKSQQQTLTQDSDGKVLTGIFLIEDLQLTGINCSDNFKFAGGSATLVGEAGNYYNGTATGKLTFKVSH